jgi:hypothetical protein
MAKVSGRNTAKGSSTPIRKTSGANTVTPSDDKPHSARPQPAFRNESEKLEARKKVPTNRAKVKPIGNQTKRRKAA